MKKLITLVSILILAGCGGDGSNVTAGAGGSTESVAFGKFKPTSETDALSGTTLSCKLSKDAPKTQPEYIGGTGTLAKYNVNVDCKAHNPIGFWQVSATDTGPAGCSGLYADFGNPKPPKVVNFSCEIEVLRYGIYSTLIGTYQADHDPDSVPSWFIDIYDGKYPEISLSRL